jgi:hypothetical protein
MPPARLTLSLKTSETAWRFAAYRNNGRTNHGRPLLRPQLDLGQRVDVLRNLRVRASGFPQPGMKLLSADG